MKRMQSLLGALTLSSILLTPVYATEDTKDITTTDGTKSQEGKIYGTLTGEKLKQLKVILPIKIDIAVAPVVTMENSNAPMDANRVYNGDYRIKVAADSEIGVQLDSINLKELSDWKLSSKDEVESMNMDKITAETKPTAARTISLNIGGKEMVIGENAFGDGEYYVPISQEKSLGLHAQAGKVWLDKDMKSQSEQAFRITYTISQK